MGHTRNAAGPHSSWSAGGDVRCLRGRFCALYYAAHYPGAIAVPVNPQIDLANYGVGAVDRYGRLGWGLTGANLVKKIPAVTDLRRLYRQDRDVRVFYLQNLNDRTHMSGHFDHS